MKKEFFLLLFMFSFGCTNSPIIFEAPDYFSPSDTFMHDAPFVIKSNDTWEDLEDIHKLHKILGLEKIHRGVDSLEIRIWFTYSFKDTVQLVRIKYKDGKWIGQQMMISEKLQSDTVNYNIVFNEELIPKSGWSFFLQKLSQLNITKLPDYKLLSEYNRVTDGHLVSVEIATKSYYRMFSYPTPYINEHLQQARDIISIIKLLESQTNFRRLIII